jgi:hypothetical protein
MASPRRTAHQLRLGVFGMGRWALIGLAPVILWALAATTHALAFSACLFSWAILMLGVYLTDRLLLVGRH